MPSLDAASLAQQVVSLGLVSPPQLQECVNGAGSSDTEALLRVLERKGYLTSLQIDKLRKGDRDGYLLGGYRILYKIASGTFGRVFRADDSQTGRVVAIKVLRKRWSDNPGNVELFEREGRVGMSLRHPNIVEIIAVGRDPATRQYFIVMEFVEGGNLRDLLAIRKKFEADEALRLLEDMAAALAYAHARGVMHRDIKLTNILLASQGMAKLVDFGLAQMYSSMGITGDTHVQRTVDYAGLEKSTGVKAGDARSDIYFLGCVLYEMLTGRPPLFLTRDKRARMQRSRFENVPPIDPEEVQAPASVLRLVETMMALNPVLRYQTASQLLDAVRQARLDIEGGGNGAVESGRPAVTSAATTVFVVESDERLQDVIRDKLKKMGYRVLMAAAAQRAVERFASQPFACVIVDAGSTAEEGLQAFKRILNQARHKNIPCHGILILSEDQREWASLLDPQDPASVLIRPLKMGQLVEKLREVVPVSTT